MRKKHIDGSVRIAAIVVLLATSIFLIRSSSRVTPVPGGRFEDVARRIVVATEHVVDATPARRFAPGDFAPWQALTRQELPGWLSRADRCPENPGGRIFVAYGDAPITSRLVPSQGETLMALAADLADAIDVEVWPCRGAPRSFSVAELTEAPDRYLLTPRANGVALFDSTESTVVLQPIAAVLMTVASRRVALDVSTEPGRPWLAEPKP